MGPGASKIGAAAPDSARSVTHVKPPPDTSFDFELRDGTVMRVRPVQSERTKSDSKRD